jgi:hypothetical protein
VEINDFFNFDTNKIKYFYENLLILGPNFSYDTQKIIKDFEGDSYYFWPTHSPRMFSKTDINDIINQFPEISNFTQTAKFRTKNDLQLIYIYGYYLLSKGK